MDLLLLLNLTNFLQVDARLKKAQTAKDYCLTEVTKQTTENEERIRTP